jgi:RimJ/RimL family protein N-acetyltransferase
VDGPAHLTTDRLRLDAIESSDLMALFPIFNDVAGWSYDPQGRHLDVGRTTRWIRKAHQRWALDGLSYWTLRRSDTWEVIGVGGVQRHATNSWNLFYRLATSSWGCGFATEVAWAAVAAAHDHDDHVPVIAWIADHNEPSRRVAERIGLRNCGLRIDANDGRLRLAYADRPLPPA